MGEKTQQNFLDIDSQYNAKKLNQNTREYPTLSNVPLSSFFFQLQLPNLRTWWVNEWVIKWGVDFLYLYKLAGVGKVSLHWVGPTCILSG